MTPKEKAEELVKKFKKVGIRQTDEVETWSAKQCALIVVEEIVYSYPSDPYYTLQPKGIDVLDYWREVKTEIEKL